MNDLFLISDMDNAFRKSGSAWRNVFLTCSPDDTTLCTRSILMLGTDEIQ